MVENVRREPRVFVIRIWHECSAEAGGSKRGYVEHIETGQRCYFSQLIDALEFVAALGLMPLDRQDERRES
jgi:hypothetical protein